MHARETNTEIKRRETGEKHRVGRERKEKKGRTHPTEWPLGQSQMFHHAKEGNSTKDPSDAKML